MILRATLKGVRAIAMHLRATEGVAVIRETLQLLRISITMTMARLIKRRSSMAWRMRIIRMTILRTMARNWTLSRGGTRA